MPFSISFATRSRDVLSVCNQTTKFSLPRPLDSVLIQERLVERHYRRTTSLPQHSRCGNKKRNIRFLSRPTDLRSPVGKLSTKLSNVTFFFFFSFDGKCTTLPIFSSRTKLVTFTTFSSNGQVASLTAQEVLFSHLLNLFSVRVDTITLLMNAFLLLLLLLLLRWEVHHSSHLLLENEANKFYYVLLGRLGCQSNRPRGSVQSFIEPLKRSEWTPSLY